MNGLLIGISGHATAGKDTFATILSSIIKDRPITRVAFADALKAELEPFFRAFGGTAYETDSEKKKRIRPILVSHGCSMREVTEGRYWVDKAEPTVRTALDRGHVVLVTDVRFENEARWVKELGGKVIYLEREGVGPANAEEAKNGPLVEALADVRVKWPTISVDRLAPFVYDAWSRINRP